MPAIDGPKVRIAVVVCCRVGRLPKDGAHFIKQIERSSEGEIWTLQTAKLQNKLFSYYIRKTRFFLTKHLRMWKYGLKNINRKWL